MQRSPASEDGGGLHRTFTNALRAAREACGWSQADLAGRVGISVEAYGRLERGRVLPRAATLVRLARALNVRVDDLLGLVEVTRDERRLSAAMGRLRAVPPKDLRFLMAVLAELEKWRESQ